jgi:hypothetical protein
VELVLGLSKGAVERVSKGAAEKLPSMKGAGMKSTFVRQDRLRRILWYGCLFGFALGWSLIAISWGAFDCQKDEADYCVFYMQAQGVQHSAFLNPFWVLFILKPLAVFPFPVSFVAFALLNAIFIAVSVRFTQPNPYLFLISLPVYRLFTTGQLDGFVMLGTALGWFAVERRRPYLLGLAIVFLLVKPHVGGLIIMLYLWWLRDWRILIVPLVTLILSQIWWGFWWPIAWLQTLLSLRHFPGGVLVNVSLYPYGLLTWLVLLVPMPRLERLISIISASMLSFPYAPIYSLLTLLILPLPWWVHVPVNLPYFMGPTSFWLGAFTPLLALTWAIWRSLEHKIPTQLVPFSKH